MPYPEITKATETIHNPADPRHFMRVKLVNRNVKVFRDGRLLADTRNAYRVTEIAGDVLDPVFYIPRNDVEAEMLQVAGKTTHCPLKGDATYFEDGQEIIAWAYDKSLDFANVLNGLVAFYADKVEIREIGETS